MSSTNSVSGVDSDAAAPARHLARKDVVKITIACFLAWVFSVYDFTLFGTLLPEIAKDFGLTVSESTALATWVTVGTFVISVALTPLLDRYGRRTMLIVTVLGAAVSSGATGLAVGALSMVIIRSFSGFGYSEEVVNSMYINEVYGKSKRRGLIYGMVQGGWPIGALMAAGLTSILLPLVGWRWSFVIAMLPAIGVAIAARRLPESPVFLGLQKMKAARTIGNADEVHAIAAEYDIPATPENKAHLSELFGQGMRLHSICTLLVWFLNWMAVQVLLVLGTTVLTDGKGISFANSLLILVTGNAVGYLGFIIHGWLGDKFGRRATVIVGWTLAFLVTVAMLLGPSDPGYIYTMYALTSFFMSGPVAALMFYMGEAYPPHIRGLGMNVAHMMGPLGAIAGAGLLTFLLSIGLPMVTSALLSGSLPLLIAALLMFGTRRVEQHHTH